MAKKKSTAALSIGKVQGNARRGQSASEFAEQFGIVLAKTRLDGMNRVDITVGEWDEGREKVVDLVGTYGWEGTMHLMASCLRLWAEVPGIRPVPPTVKDTCHELAQIVQGAAQNHGHEIDVAAGTKAVTK